jgi:Asp-tRNA(Asn)/Glu-tRNA(Gln) amidotransferase A subunit family amidase
LNRPGLLPVGVQIVGNQGCEAMAFALAAKLERLGLVRAHPPQ